MDSSDQMLDNTEKIKAKGDDLNLCKMIGFGIGHFINDITLSCYYNFLSYYIIFVAKLPKHYPTILLVTGEAASAVTHPIIGFFSDKTKTNIGKKTPWYIVGFILMILSFSFIFQTCYLCDDQAALPDYQYSQIIWYISFVIIYQIASSCIMITHFSLAPVLSLNKRNKDFLLRVRTFCTFFANFISSGISYIIFQIADTFHLEYILYPSICLGLGVITSIIFLCLLNEQQTLKHIAKYKYEMKTSLKKHSLSQNLPLLDAISHNIRETFQDRNKANQKNNSNTNKYSNYNKSDEAIVNETIFTKEVKNNINNNETIKDYSHNNNSSNSNNSNMVLMMDEEDSKDVEDIINSLGRDKDNILTNNLIEEKNNYNQEIIRSNSNNVNNLPTTKLPINDSRILNESIINNSKELNKNNFFNSIPEDNKEVVINISQPRPKYFINWFRQLDFYLYGLVIISVKIMIRVNAIYLPLYMIYHFEIEKVVGKTPGEISIALLIMYVGSMIQLLFIQSFIVRKTSRRNDRVILITISFVVLNGSYISLYFLSNQYDLIFYFMMFPIGVGIAQALSTATCLVNDVIGAFAHEGAFVFGFYFFVAKVALAVLLVKLPTDRENMLFIGNVFYFFPVITVTLSTFLIVIRYIFEKRKRKRVITDVSDHSFLDNSMFSFED